MVIKINGELCDFPDSEKESENYSRMLMKKLLSEAGLSLTKAVKRLNEKYPEHKTTTQNISNKLARDTIKFQEFRELAEVCGYCLSFEKIKEPKSSNDSISTTKKKEPKPIRVNDDRQIDIGFANLAKEGYAECDSVNFIKIIVAGKQAEKAAEFIKMNESADLDETQEIMLLIAANREYKVKCKPIAEGRNFEMI